jgi:hypothetical protein
MKANTSSSKDIQQFFEKIEQQPVAGFLNEVLMVNWPCRA